MFTTAPRRIMKPTTTTHSPMPPPGPLTPQRPCPASTPPVSRRASQVPPPGRRPSSPMTMLPLDSSNGSCTSIRRMSPLSSPPDMSPSSSQRRATLPTPFSCPPCPPPGPRAPGPAPGWRLSVPTVVNPLGAPKPLPAALATPAQPEAACTAHAIYRCLSPNCGSVPSRADRRCSGCGTSLSLVCLKCRAPLSGPVCDACGAITVPPAGPSATPVLLQRGFLLGAPLHILSLILEFAACSRHVFAHLSLVCRDWVRAMEATPRLRNCLASLRLRQADIEPGRRIATASYGIVRTGSHRSTGAVFAVKLIDSTMGWDKATVDSFNPFTLSCPYVSPPLACWIEGEEESYLPTSQSLIIVEEFCDRSSLAQLGACCKSVPENMLAGLAKQMCQALAFLHEGQWRSRTKRTYDLTPLDFLLTSAGAVKVTTTPVAKCSSSGALSPDVKKIYLAPEVIKGQPWTEKADSWTVGIILIELALGQYPFRNDRLMTLIKEITTCTSMQFPLRLSRLGRDFLLKCVGPEPGDRPAMRPLLQHSWMALAATEAEIAQWLEAFPTLRTSSTYSSASSTSS
eukprot:EG_transcript_4860